MAKQHSDDKRGFHRIVYHADAFAYGGTAFTPCKVADISLKGCLVELPEEWLAKAQTVDRVEILLAGGLSINMQVSLTHTQDAMAGYRCDHIDLDSVTTLRRMIELNLGDSDLLDRDIKALVHPSPPARK
ncbi:PilZ domain-containing protein, partial [Methylogaea oryzae]